jgi:hypothetical protein
MSAISVAVIARVTKAAKLEDSIIIQTASALQGKSVGTKTLDALWTEYDDVSPFFEDAGDDVQVSTLKERGRGLEDRQMRVAQLIEREGDSRQRDDLIIDLEAEIGALAKTLKTVQG